MISVIDYGVSNLGSILNMLKKIGAEAEIVTEPDGLDRAKKIILPGVGAFDQGMCALEERGMVEPLKRVVLENKVPILGVCLGMQILGDTSEEGRKNGLSLIKGNCRRFNFGNKCEFKVPHMGWTEINTCKESPLLIDIRSDSRYYFVHSFHFVPDDPLDILAVAEYCEKFVAMVQHDNIYGAQFHPEKSHRHGMALLKNFHQL
jgi:glutamine amidotransferase